MNKRLYANRDNWFGIIVVGDVDVGVARNSRVHVLLL